MREIPVKNYFVLVSIAVAVIVISFVLRGIYIKKNGNIQYASVVKEVVTEIKYDDLDNYLQENPTCVLYINNSKKKNKSIQKDTKKIILDNSIQQYVVYVERTDDIAKKYDLNSNSPIFVAYQNGVLTEIFSKDSYTAKEIESFFVRNKVIEDD
jgi:hypothetical protein